MLLYTTPSTGDRIRLQEVRVLCWATPQKKKQKKKTSLHKRVKRDIKSRREKKGIHTNESDIPIAFFSGCFCFFSAGRNVIHLLRRLIGIVRLDWKSHFAWLLSAAVA